MQLAHFKHLPDPVHDILAHFVILPEFIFDTGSKGILDAITNYLWHSCPNYKAFPTR
jgi:hypothetical protein